MKLKVEVNLGLLFKRSSNSPLISEKKMFRYICEHFHVCKSGKDIPQCYLQRPKANGLMVQEKKTFKEFLPSNGSHLGQVTINICYKLTQSPYEIRVQLAWWFLRKLCSNILMVLQYESPWLKGEKSTLTFRAYL